jgi:tetratricopeptide (TPR) repeat protein
MEEKIEILDCSEMSDEELARALTRDKREYDSDSLSRMRREMANRKLDLASFIDRVKVSLNEAEPEDCAINQALARLKQEMSLWQIWHVVNGLQEKIALQKEVAFWTVHLFDQDNYQQSYLLKTAWQVENYLSLFLRLDEGKYTADHEYSLDECETFMDSFSSGATEKISRTLAQADIPHTVRQHELMSPHVLIPPEYREAADQIAAGIEKKVLALREEIAALAGSYERHPRLLELYNQLAELVDGDPTVSYGRGVLLFESGRNAEAAEAFIETVGTQGNLTDAEYEAHQKESEEYLLRLSAALPDNVSILHTLAHKAMSEKDNANAIARYEKILAVFPSDSIAHMNLGFLYYQDPNANTRAARHFKTYLELEPQAEDRAAIEEILASL